MTRAGSLTLAGALAALMAAEAACAEPVNRWGTEFNRATRVPRASDIYIRRPPIRVHPVKPAPEIKTYKKKSVPEPHYGAPDPAIDRIPET